MGRTNTREIAAVWMKIRDLRQECEQVHLCGRCRWQRLRASRAPVAS